MLHLTYSNRTEALLEALGRDLADWRARSHVFDPVRLVVPNRNVETWVKHQLARRDGIVANIETLQLRRFVAGLLDSPEAPVRLADAGVLEDLLLSLLLDDDYLSQRGLERVRDYLYAGGASADAVDIRRVQLARVLGQLFEEYGYSREELLAAWPRGVKLAGTPFAEIEAWQRRLWLDARELLRKRCEQTGERCLPLPELLAAAPAKLGDGRPVFMFGVSYVARAFQRILAGLARAGDLHVYTLNPCAEFWEDIPAGWELRKLDKKLPRLGADALAEFDPFGLAKGPQGYPLLQLWGRPGRENIRLLNEVADCDFQAAFDDPLEREPTLLRLVQGDILRNMPEPEGRRIDLSQDSSLRVLACPGIRREAEVIAGEIWSLMEADEKRSGREPLRFNDIAVLVAGSDPETYFTHLAAVFEETYGIPFSISDSPFAAESRVAEAVAMLLELPFGRFSRSELMRFLTHPTVAGRYGEIDPGEWLGWCKAVGIVHGADHADHANTYIERDILNWDQGMRRLALGAVMTGPRSGEQRALELDLRGDGAERYLPEELGQSSQGSAASFGLLARSLIADLRFARSARLTTAQWAELLGAMVETYVSPRGEQEERELERCLRAVRSVAEYGLDGREVSCRVASELASASLGSISGGRGQYLSRGVVISTLQPMRALPFRVVFIAGLGEGRFPAQDRRNQLDLRQAKPQAGDVSPRERDEYMFLEGLLCARDRLYLSYVSRHELTGDSLEPAPVVAELLRVVERWYLPEREEGAPSPLVETHALRRYEPRYFPALHGQPGPEMPASPAARAEAKALAFRGQIAAALGSGIKVPDLGTLREALSESGRALLDRQLRLHIERPAGGLVLPETLRLSLSRLRGFLECPLQAGAKQLLKLQDDDGDDLLDREDEPFCTELLERVQLLRGGFVEKLAREARGEPASFEAVYDARGERLVASGRMPTGVFREVEREGHLAVLRDWERLLREGLGDEACRPERVRFGAAADEHDGADDTFDPIVVGFDPGELGPESPGLRVEIVGATEPLVLGRRASLTLINRSLGSNKVVEALRAGRVSLRGFVDAVALAAAGQGGAGHQSLICVTNGVEGKLDAYSFEPIGRDEALAWLRRVVADMLSGVHDYLLTAEAVLHYGARADSPGFAEALEEVFALFSRSSHGSSYGPIKRIDVFGPPEERRACELIARRWGLYFEKRAMPLDSRFPVEAAAVTVSGGARPGEPHKLAVGAALPTPADAGEPLDKLGVSRAASGAKSRNVVRGAKPASKQGDLFGAAVAPQPTKKRTTRRAKKGGEE
ncbi:MAG: exodeoxyribonuclease V subunit gamma [Myxococcales bacterium]|jgi:exodeoxyribonuclease V gamma subunit